MPALLLLFEIDLSHRFSDLGGQTQPPSRVPDEPCRRPTPSDRERGPQSDVIRIRRSQKVETDRQVFDTGNDISQRTQL